MSGGTSQPAPADARGSDTVLAGAIKELLARGDSDGARARFDEIVARHQRRASRIAYHYLRNVAEADEVVQEAFVKAFVHLPSFREALPFEVWFTRILVNSCLDQLKARARRDRWMVPLLDPALHDQRAAQALSSVEPSPEEEVLRRERWRHVVAAVDRLPERQRTVVVLSHFDGRSTREVSAITGLNESTVRVHQFRAIRALRRLLAPEQWLNRDVALRTKGRKRG